MKKAILAMAAALALMAMAGAAFAQQTASLDEAIRLAAEELSGAIGRDGRVAVIAMGSDSDDLSGFLVSEMIHALVRWQGELGFSVVDRAQLDLLLAQLEFDMSGFVDDNTAQSIGRFLGAQFIVVGEFEVIGAALFRFRARLLEVETAAIRESFAASVRNDETIATLRGAAPAAPAPPVIATIFVAPPSTTPAPSVIAAIPAAPTPVSEPVRPEMVGVQGGTFRMNRRRVTLSAFSIGKFPVTQGEWYDVMGTRPSRFTGESNQSGTPVTGVNWRNLPVERVSWFDAVEFANRLSIARGLEPAYVISGTGMIRVVTWNRSANGYRLPTEVEWEFAARGGMACRGNFEFPGSNVVGEVAWYSGNSMERTHEIGLLCPNALGIYDMSGNVWEWVWDWSGTLPGTGRATNPVGASSGSFRVMRGGGWVSSAELARSVHRFSGVPSQGRNSSGFRLARSTQV